MAASGTRYLNGNGYDTPQNKAVGAGAGRPDIGANRVSQRHPPVDSGFRGEGWDTAQNRAMLADASEKVEQPSMEGGDGEGGIPFDPQRVFRDAWAASQSFMEAGIAAQWEKNLRNWQGKHPKGSKYLSEEYRARSRLFRPKTRAAVRKAEAACAAAFFSTNDVVNFTANDPENPLHVAAANFAKALVQYRLTRTIPWFLTCIGAFQDAQVYGVCISRQRWEYQARTVRRQRPRMIPSIDPVTGQLVGVEPLVDEDGQVVLEEVDEVEVIADRPVIDLIPPENFRIHPGADWRDPVNSSPYIICRWPLFVTDVKAKMRSRDAKTGQPEWRELPDSVLLKARTVSSDTIRTAREAPRPDSHDNDTGITDFDTVWVNEVIVRIDGQDWHYWTLGEDGEVLSREILPLEEVYLHGERPYAMGVGIIETHKVYPASKVEVGQDLQAEANEIANTRLDNAKLAMNGRVVVKRGGDVDLQALLRSTPGGAILANSVEDVKFDRPPDVTGSAFQEQDRIDLQLDELLGNFSQTSVQTNRKLNETVGGMQLLAGAANAIGEYDLRVFAETWVERVMRQIAHLEQRYEDDEKVLAIAANDARLVKMLGGQITPAIMDRLLAEDVLITANVGIGATDPAQRLGQLRAAVEMTALVFGEEARMWVKPEEMLDEIWGRSGFRNGRKFFDIQDGQMPTDPRVPQLEEALQQTRAELEKAKSGEAQQLSKIQSEERLGILRLLMERYLEEQRLKAEREKAQNELAFRERDTQQQLQVRRQEKLVDKYAEAGLLAGGEGEEAMDPLRNVVNAVVPRVEQIVQEVAGNLQQMMQRSLIQVGDSLGRLERDIGAIDQRVSEVARDVGSMDGRLSELAEDVSALAKQADAPREIVRDEKGRPVGVRIDGITRKVQRDKNGKIVGLE